ncbi:glycoside hydrolase family 25 protein [Pontibacter oryzae]|uniref:Glycoside hydrolase family 25 protein n=1 Tax=Pontibacter oryzae TaxID=2304593 RepID=A0A399RY50_9BACT|nr:GH25 family lysozyme [Pontibacter oryzae]RIJ34345.1 glycoside hydrolase family 25 protein [Pontibacter oryzae]
MATSIKPPLKQAPADKAFKAPAKRQARTAKPRKKQQKQPPKRFWVGLAILAGIIVLVMYVEYFVEKRVPAWPEGHTVYGIDVSHFQKEVDWQKVRESEVVFAFVKATEGVSLKDKKYEQNWTGAGAAGIIRGAYHFYLPYLSPKEQAANFVATVQLTSGDLPPVLDIEVRGRKPLGQFRKDLKVWLEQVENAYGAKPVIYTNYKFYEDYLAGHFDSYPLWIAHYKVPKLSIEKSSTRKLAFWQHTDGGSIDGIEGSVDCNVFYGSMRDLRSICIP